MLQISTRAMEITLDMTDPGQKVLMLELCLKLFNMYLPTFVPMVLLSPEENCESSAREGPLDSLSILICGSETKIEVSILPW